MFDFLNLKLLNFISTDNHFRRLVAKVFNNEYIWLALILLLGLVLRLINLGAEPYWGDEILSLDIARHFYKLTDLISYLRVVEVHPPLYYLLLHYWTWWFGISEFAVRSLSVIFGLGVIVMVNLLTKSLFPFQRWLRLLVSLLVAILPIQIEFSQEARPYIIFAFFGLLATLGLWQWLERRQWKNIAVYVLSITLGLYLHYSFILFLLACASYWLINIIFIKRQQVAKQIVYWLITHFVIFLLFYWWFSTFLYKTIFLGQYAIFYIERSYHGALKSLGFFESIISQLIWFSKDKPTESLVVVVILIFKILVIWFLVSLLINRQSSVSLAANDNQLTKFLFISWLFFIPIILFIFTPQSISYTPTYYRHIIISSAFVVLLLSILLINLTVRKRMILLFIFLGSLIPFLVTVEGNDEVWDRQHRIKEVAVYVNDNYRSGDLVLVAIESFRSDFNHFLKPEIEAVSLYPVNFYGFDFLNSRETLGLIENEMQLRVMVPSKFELADKLTRLINIKKASRVWLVYFDSKSPVYQWFDQHGWRHAFYAIGDLFPLDLYSLK
ncbi:MAG: glycosyltransferase family 39 protein [Patescibacteria group bacterium]